MEETRKEYEERLLTEFLRLSGESLSNIFLYASEFLEGRTLHDVRKSDLKTASLMSAYMLEFDKRIREVR